MKTHRIAFTAAALLGSAGLTLGLAQPAMAATNPATPAAHKGCKHAPVIEARLEQTEKRIEARIDRLQAAEAKAKANHHDALADRIEHRLDMARRHHDKVADRLSKIEARCGSVAATSPSTPAS